MFENVGVKIKGIAKVFFAVGMLVPLFCGIVVIALDKKMAPIGIIIIFLGALLAWLATVLLYGFGELIFKTSLIESKLNPNQSASPTRQKENLHISVEVLCWHYLFSQPVARQLSSAQMSLTSVFGMGTGGPSSQSIPTSSMQVSYPSLRCKQQSSLIPLHLLSEQNPLRWVFVR